MRNPLTRSFKLLEENRKELGSIRAESIFSDNYRVELPEDFPFLPDSFPQLPGFL